MINNELKLFVTFSACSSRFTSAEQPETLG